MGYWKNAARWVGCLLALVAVLGTLPVALATQEGGQDGTEAADDARSMMQMVTSTNPEAADDPITTLNVQSATYFKDFTYDSNILFSGIYKTNKFYFQIPNYWDCQYAYAQIEAELSQLIQDVPASLTFMINNTPIATYRMDYQNGGTQVFYVEIPLEYVQEGYNSFDITGYVRLYDEDGCIDDFSGANWISVRGSSFIQVGYEAQNAENRVSAYPYPFLSSLNESGSETEILVSDKCDTDELAAALMLRADLAGETDTEDAIVLAKLSDSDSAKHHRIVVGLYGNLDAHYRAIADQAAAGESLDAQAVIYFLQDSDADTLLIASNSGEALTEAAELLLDETRVIQEKTDRAFVRENTADTLRAQIGSSLKASTITLDSLLDSGLSFIGPFHQEGDIYLPFSGGYVLAESGTINLKFRYSENLNFDRSMITVYWGDVPVSSKRLTKENAGGDTLSFIMPEDVVGTYAGKITIAFDLELPDLFCTPRMDEMPWAYVTGDSTFYLPVGAGGNYSLSDRPYPFEVSFRFNELQVVIPENISETELDTLGRVIAIYGEQITPYGSLTVSYADALTTKEQKSGNMIVVGTYNDNRIIRELNENLSFRYSDDGNRFASNDTMILSDSYARSISTLQIFPSPYAEDRAVLVVGALDDAGMENLRDFLTDSTNVWKLEKDTVLLDTDRTVTAFELAEQRVATSTPIIKRMLEANREAAIFTLVSVGVIALMLLAVILILIRIYWRQKKNK